MGPGFPAPISVANMGYNSRDRTKYNIDIRESVDSLCRDGADAQYKQYLTSMTSLQPTQAQGLYVVPGACDKSATVNTDS